MCQLQAGGEPYDHVPSSLSGDPRSELLGPIYLRRGVMPVAPVVPWRTTMLHGKLVQLPIFWSALSLALGTEIRGHITFGLPCSDHTNNFYCSSPGQNYPKEEIEYFIDQNKALMKRMFGEFQADVKISSSSVYRISRNAYEDLYEVSNLTEPHSEDERLRRSKRGRMVFQRRLSNSSNKVNSCESSQEIVTPYWASNSAGDLRAIVNTEHFEQAIQQELCKKKQSLRCRGDCTCEQKYKWHRLLTYNPEERCRGIFMDWFLFPSCCVCSCESNF